MKKLLYLVVPCLLLFVSCSKDLVREDFDESYWLNQDRAVVVYSDYHCPYFVVETRRGYSVIASRDGYAPYNGAVLYGNFYGWGIRTFYNRSEGYLLSADVTDYGLSYYAAIDEANFQCY